MVDINKAFELTETGLIFSIPFGDIVWIGAGTADPSQSPGQAAPLGSTYYQNNGDEYKKSGPLATDWTLAGLGSDVATQNADFGKSGQASKNSFLRRAGNVPSNISGIPILLSFAKINSVAASNRDVDTYTVEVYEHEGDFINPVLKHSLTVTNARSGVDTGLDIVVTQGKQLAIKTLSSVKNVGVTVGMKGLAT